MQDFLTDSPAEFTPQFVRNFWAKVNLEGTKPDQTNPHYRGLNRCWEWEGARLVGGYGQTKFKRRTFPAHRVSFSLINGFFPVAGIHVLHRCDNPRCVNPDHLFTGTAADNVRDKQRKGRCNSPTGSRHGAKTKPGYAKRAVNKSYSEVSESTVVDLRLYYATGGFLQKRLAEMFGLSGRTVRNILARKTWNHI